MCVLYIYIYVCVCVCVFYMSVCVCVCVCVRARAYKRVCARACMCMSECVSACLRAYMCMCVWVCVSVCVGESTRPRVCVCPLFLCQLLKTAAHRVGPDQHSRSTSVRTFSCLLQAALCVHKTIWQPVLTNQRRSWWRAGLISNEVF